MAYSSRLGNVNYLKVIDSNFTYHNLPLLVSLVDSCILRLLFGGATASDMFQRKIDKIFKNIPNASCVENGILVAGYNVYCMDHGKTIRSAENRLKMLNSKMSFQVYQHSILQWNNIEEWIHTWPMHAPSTDRKQVLTCKCRIVWTTAIPGLSQSRMDTYQTIPRAMQQNQGNDEKNYRHAWSFRMQNTTIPRDRQIRGRTRHKEREKRKTAWTAHEIKPHTTQYCGL